MFSIEKGIIRAYDDATGKATVEIVGSHPFYIEVPCACDLPENVVQVGSRCALAFFNSQQPDDGLLFAVYDETQLHESGAVTLNKAEASANSAQNTTSTSLTDLDSMSVTVTVPGPAIVMLVLTMQCRSGVAGNSTYAQLADSSNNAIGQEWTMNANDRSVTATLYEFNTIAAAGSKTYKARWRVSAGTSYCATRHLTAVVFGS